MFAARATMHGNCERTDQRLPPTGRTLETLRYSSAMPEGRPKIPAQVEREVKMEAGYRCAIPACRQHPVEIAHIVPWSKVRVHEYRNLIALCGVCHARFDRGVASTGRRCFNTRRISVL
jgi:hypothetical protein